MLARRLPTILPRMSLDEALETTKIHSVAGTLPLGESLVARRPFRAPHHTISDAGLIGGGSYPRPGEGSLAQGGVLFLDELPEFRKNVLEVLRQPMEDGVVTIARAAMSLTYPARFMLAAAMNPCPCGYSGDPQHTGVCGPLGVERSLARVSGPLLARFDIHLEVPAVKYRALADQGGGEPSEAMRERVDRARAVQRDRFASRPGIYANAHMAARDIRTFCRVSDGADALLRTAITRLALSARAYHRILKIARTIPDLDKAADLAPKHVSEAIQYRSLDRRGVGGGFDMFTACLHVRSMSKMIQIRNAPDDLHRTLKARAATEGMSLSDSLLRELRQLADQPTLSEFLERLRQREPVKLRESPAAIIRRFRDAGDRP